MIAAGAVNWSFVLILVGPSLVVLGIMWLTWRSRMRRSRDDQRRDADKPPRGSGGKRRPK
jgi:hypothetical protein